MSLASDDARTPVASTALVASLVISATPCRMRSVFVLIDPSAPTDVYYPQIHNTATLPANTTATSSRVAPGEISHTSGDFGDGYTFDFGPNGIAMTSGAVVALSTTQYTLTIAGGAYMTVQAVTG